MLPRTMVTLVELTWCRKYGNVAGSGVVGGGSVVVLGRSMLGANPPTMEAVEERERERVSVMVNGFCEWFRVVVMVIGCRFY